MSIYFPEHDGNWRFVWLGLMMVMTEYSLINIIGLLAVYDTFTFVVASHTGTKPTCNYSYYSCK
jgi:hypothetical protein